MQTFHTMIDEIFDRTVPWRWTSTPADESRGTFTATFTVTPEHGPAWPYVVNLDAAQYENNDTIDDEYVLNFQIDHRSPDRSQSVVDRTRDKDVFDIVGGTGASFEVFGTVVEIIKAFIAKERPKAIHFSAKEPSRIRLYRRFAKQCSTTIHKYYGIDYTSIGRPGVFAITRVGYTPQLDAPEEDEPHYDEDGYDEDGNKGYQFEAAPPTIIVGGRLITVTQPPHTPGESLVWVNVAKLDAGWSRDGSFYLDRTGKNRIGNRYENIAKFMQTTTELSASEVSVGKSGVVMFGDGRHRFAFLRDQGLTSVPVSMSKESQRYADAFGYLT